MVNANGTYLIGTCAMNDPLHDTEIVYQSHL